MKPSLVPEPEVPALVDVQIETHVNEDNIPEGMNSYQVDAIVSEIAQAVDEFSAKVESINAKYMRAARPI